MRVRVVLLVLCVAMASVLCVAAGRWDLPFVWGMVLVYAVSGLIIGGGMDPGLRQERLHPGPGGRDRQMRWWMLPLILAFWVVAGLENRWRTDPGRWLWVVQCLGLAGLAGSMGFSGWAMRVNRFFSPVVRIQSERGHHLVTAGPYGWIRHPGYLGAIVGTLSGAAALGSGWALIPGSLMVLMVLRRLALEDRFLAENLPGYAEYRQQVRWRLVPGLW